MFYPLNMNFKRNIAQLILAFSFSMAAIAVVHAQAIVTDDKSYAAYFLPVEYPEATATQDKDWLLIWAAAEEDVDEEPLRFAVTRAANSQYVFMLIYRLGQFCDIQVREVSDEQLNIYAVSELQVDGRPLQARNALKIIDMLSKGQSIFMRIDTGEFVTFSLAGAQSVLAEAREDFAANTAMVCVSYGS